MASRTLEGTAFILLDSRMVSLNVVGSRIWELCRDGTTIERAARQIAAEYETTEETAARDAARFVDELLARGLLVRDEDPVAGSGGASEGSAGE